MLKNHIYAKMINQWKTMKMWHWSHVPTAIIDEALAKIFCYNHGHNTFRLFDVWANFPFTTSETKRDY